MIDPSDYLDSIETYDDLLREENPREAQEDREEKSHECSRNNSIADSIRNARKGS